VHQNTNLPLQVLHSKDRANPERFTVSGQLMKYKGRLMLRPVSGAQASAKYLHDSTGMAL